MVIGIDCSRALAKDPTGTEYYSRYVVREMLRLPASRKHRFVLFIRPKVEIPNWMQRKGLILCTIPYKYLWTQVGLAQETWRNKLDVLFVPAHTLPVVRRGFGGIGRALKTVVTIHGLEYKWLPEYRNWLQKWYLPLSTFYAVRQANKLIAVSQFTRGQLIDELGVEREKIEVIYEGVESQLGIQDSKFKNKVLKKYGLKAGKYILFVGTLQPRKNLPALIRAFSLINRQNQELKLVLAGGNGWLTEEIFRVANRSKMNERIVFTGRVGEEELRELYMGARLYVQPSFQEGFGLPILEAMKAGVPVVASNGGALPEVVGKAGKIVKLGERFEARLAKEIGKGLWETSWRAKWTAVGKKRVSKFGWKKAAEKTLSVLTNC